MTLLAIGLAFSGFIALCLGMEKHQMDLYGAARAPATTMQRIGWAGWALTAAAFLAAVLARGWAVGTVLWLGAMTLAGIVITYGLLPYRPRWIKPAAYAVPTLAAVLWMAGIA
jgi:hypothetical protein